MENGKVKIRTYRKEGRSSNNNNKNKDIKETGVVNEIIEIMDMDYDGGDDNGKKEKKKHLQDYIAKSVEINGKELPWEEVERKKKEKSKVRSDLDKTKGNNTIIEKRQVGV